MRWRNCINCVMALWIIVSPWIVRVPSQPNLVGSCIVGGVILLGVSLWGAIADSWSVFGLFVSAACCLWFIVQPFLGPFTVGAYWEIVLPGIIALCMDFWTFMTHPVSLRPGSGTRSGT